MCYSVRKLLLCNIILGVVVGGLFTFLEECVHKGGMVGCIASVDDSLCGGGVSDVV